VASAIARTTHGYPAPKSNAGFWLCHARETRKRYSALDLAADASLLEAFAAGEG
jgi:hypothetical protein